METDGETKEFEGLLKYCQSDRSMKTGGEANGYRIKQIEDMMYIYLTILAIQIENQCYISLCQRHSSFPGSKKKHIVTQPSQIGCGITH